MTAPLAPLIPREVLFGNPDNIRPQISPDGTLLAYIAPSDGVLSVWVRSIGKTDDRMIARNPARPIMHIFWQGDSRHVFYLQDRAGDENNHLFRADAGGGDARELTPGDNLKVDILALDHRFPNDVLITSNARDENVFDVYRLDAVAGTSALAAKNPGDVGGWLADNTFVVRAATVMAADGSSVIRVRDDATAPWRTLDSFSFEDGTPNVVAFSADNRSLYVLTAKDANAIRLVQYDCVTAASSVLFEDDAYDVEDVYIDPATHQLVAVAVLRARVEWTVLDEAYAADFAAMNALHAGDLQINASTADGNVLVIAFSVDAGPVPYFVFERQSQSGTLLFYNRPQLLEFTLARMTPVVMPARDGLNLHGYLTLPPGMEARGLPAVMFVHGGPWHRDRWGYDPWIQWLANRGYAVLQVNFRSSTGYGKAFLNAGNREWAGAMRTDLLDARDWAIAQGVADPARFGIMGGSYGGYAVLAALAFTPDAFTCGVDIVGPSNLNTLLASIPPYWSTMRAIFTQRMGEGEDFLNTQSPFFRAADIRAPLLIAQGANDPRVKQQESDQIVAEMRRNNIPVTYVLFEDEGHGFDNPANNKRFTAAAEAFLGQALGGRVEPAQPGEEIEPYLR